MPNYNQSHSSLSSIDNYLTVVQYVRDQPFWPSIILKIRYLQVFSLQAILSWQKISRWTCLLWSNSSSDPVSSSSSSSSHTVTTNRAESEAGIFHSFFSHPEPTIISTMVGVNKSDDPTQCNRYPNQEKEHIFACRGRPFGCLTSPHIPTPTSTLMDYSLVKDLGLKMSDLRYQKFSYCGHKLRILGKVAISVQTIHDGFASGSFHFRANVILDLNKAVDCEAVAGIKLSSRLENNSSSDDDDNSSPSTPTSSKSSPSMSKSSQSSPRTPPSSKATPSANARPLASSPAARPSATPSSPPGFPPKPQFHPHHPHAGIFKPKRPKISVSLTTIPYRNPSILDANLYALSQAFYDADLLPTPNQEVRALLEADPGGRVEPGADNVTKFRTSGGLVYQFVHGRNRCVPDKCMLVTQDQMPHNCGYHRQWYRPYNFLICGPSCPGSFCSCMENYWNVIIF